MKSCHTRSAGSSARRQDVADRDIFDEFGVEVRAGVGGAEDVGEDEFGFGVFEASFAALYDERGGVSEG